VNLHRMLLQRASEGRPVRVAVIGAGKFGSMFLHQAPRTPGIVIHGIADLSVPRARAALARIGWDAALIAGTPITEDAAALIADPGVEVVVEAIPPRGCAMRGLPSLRASMW
jgi:predicted homoserine dehydrogenase-like protein